MTLGKATMRSNRFCGPTVLSAMLGITTDDAVKLVHKLRKTTKPVKSMHLTELQRILCANGYYRLAGPNPHPRVTRTRHDIFGRAIVDTYAHPTFAQWLRARSREEREHIAVVLLCSQSAHMGHFIVVQGNTMVDSGAPNGRSVFSKFAGRRRHVQSVLYFGREE